MMPPHRSPCASGGQTENRAGILNLWPFRFEVVVMELILNICCDLIDVTEDYHLTDRQTG